MGRRKAAINAASNQYSSVQHMAEKTTQAILEKSEVNFPACHEALVTLCEMQLTTLYAHAGGRGKEINISNQ